MHLFLSFSYNQPIRSSEPFHSRPVTLRATPFQLPCHLSRAPRFPSLNFPHSLDSLYSRPSLDKEQRELSFFHFIWCAYPLTFRYICFVDLSDRRFRPSIDVLFEPSFLFFRYCWRMTDPFGMDRSGCTSLVVLSNRDDPRLRGVPCSIKRTA